jgi:hypothetical protein
VYGSARHGVALYSSHLDLGLKPALLLKRVVALLSESPLLHNVSLVKNARSAFPCARDFPVSLPRHHRTTHAHVRVRALTHAQTPCARGSKQRADHESSRTAQLAAAQHSMLQPSATSTSCCNLVQHSTPCCSVPIIKLEHHATGVEVDLSNRDISRATQDEATDTMMQLAVERHALPLCPAVDLCMQACAPTA